MTHAVPADEHVTRAVLAYTATHPGPVADVLRELAYTHADGPFYGLLGVRDLFPDAVAAVILDACEVEMWADVGQRLAPVDGALAA